MFPLPVFRILGAHARSQIAHVFANRGSECRAIRQRASSSHLWASGAGRKSILNRAGQQPNASRFSANVTDSLIAAHLLQESHPTCGEAGKFSVSPCRGIALRSVTIPQSGKYMTAARRFLRQAWSPMRNGFPKRFLRKRHYERPRIPRRSFGLMLLVALIAKASPAQENAFLPPGTYRLEMIMATVTDVPFFGKSKSASKSVSLVEIKGNGSGFSQSHRVCDFRVTEDSAMIKMVFPDKFVAALAKHTYPIQLEKDGQGWRYRADLGIERIGYRAGSGDIKLPTEASDPSVYDWDDDGHPGATLKLSVPLLPDGELYVVQRGQSILHGRITQPGKVEGEIEVLSFEHRVLGAWPSFLHQSPNIIPDPKESRFSIAPVPPGSTCDALKKTVSNAAQNGGAP